MNTDHGPLIKKQIRMRAILSTGIHFSRFESIFHIFVQVFDGNVIDQISCHFHHRRIAKKVKTGHNAEIFDLPAWSAGFYQLTH